MGTLTFKEIRRAIRSRLPIPRSLLFSYIYSMGRWGTGESRSGLGSSLAYTRNLRKQLPLVLQHYGIRSMLDAPCGDFHWMKEVPFDSTSYIGADIVPAMVRANAARYACANRRFIVLDIARDDIPPVDLIFCRDCVFHFPLALVQRTLRNFMQSQARYLLTTTFVDGVNQNIASGYHYHLNLEASPFSLPAPLLTIQDSLSEPNQFMALWDIQALPKDCF